MYKRDPLQEVSRTLVELLWSHVMIPLLPAIARRHRAAPPQWTQPAASRSSETKCNHSVNASVRAVWSLDGQKSYLTALQAPRRLLRLLQQPAVNHMYLWDHREQTQVWPLSDRCFLPVCRRINVCCVQRATGKRGTEETQELWWMERCSSGWTDASLPLLLNTEHFLCV